MQILRNATGRIGNNYNVAVFGVDVESLVRAFDSQSGSSVYRVLNGAMKFVDEIRQVFRVNRLR